jgi:hypothetical protein
MAVKSLGTMQSDEAAAAARARADLANAQPVVQSIAAHIQKCWSLAKQAKQAPEEAMIDALRARRGAYDEKTLQRIRQQGGSEIYMLLFATKAGRSAPRRFPIYPPMKWPCSCAAWWRRPPRPK